MFNNILIICVGNICRSPMAEVLFKKAFADKHANCAVISAGLHAAVGHKADENACQLMTARGLDLSTHRACQLNTQMVRHADLMLVMELRHKMEIENQTPYAKGKVFRLGEWGGYDIRDPYLLDLRTFELVLAQIDQGVNQWVNKLYP
ncbi:low molecular weight protein-tyrosine-phosphatase [Methylovulum psychrotolerans]|nr:low molecular weight protein-tyrosine-phosphatase [Methylovulum psychrotolerans]